MSRSPEVVPDGMDAVAVESEPLPVDDDATLTAGSFVACTATDHATHGLDDDVHAGIDSDVIPVRATVAIPNPTDDVLFADFVFDTTEYPDGPALIEFPALSNDTPAAEMIR